MSGIDIKRTPNHNIHHKSLIRSDEYLLSLFIPWFEHGPGQQARLPEQLYWQPSLFPLPMGLPNTLSVTSLSCPVGIAAGGEEKEVTYL